MDYINFIKREFIAVATLTLLCQPILAETVTFKKDGEIKSEPSNAAASVSTIKTSTKVDVLIRKGFWVEIKYGNVKGWTKMSNLDIKEDNSSGAADGISALSGLTSGRGGSGNIVTTAGARGLDGEQIKTAEKDDAQFKMLLTKSIKPEDAATFANAAGLKSRKITYLNPPSSSTNNKK